MYKTGNIVSTNIKTFLTYSAYIITSLILLTLFVENFVFSSGFNMLGFREIDDVAFQVSLRKIHLIIEAGQFKHLLAINDYAYGWIYWFPLALITYPLYWISAHWSIDWPLIVAPRQISLIFGIMSLFFIRKILKQYRTPKWATAVAILIFTLFPTFGYFSLRFGTVNEVMFFAALSFYLAIAEDHSTPAGRKRVIIALALAGGVKLSGLLIAPLIGALILIRYHYKSATMLARDFIFALIVFSLLLIFFSNPALYIAPFKHQISKDYFSTLTHFIDVTKHGTTSTSLVTRFYEAFINNAFNGICLLLLSIGLVMHALTQKNKRLDFIAITGTLLLGIFYLLHSVKNDNSAAVYFTSISFLLVLGITWWSNFRRGRIILTAIICLQLSDLSHRAQQQYDTGITPIHHFAYYLAALKAKHEIEESNQISKCLGAINKNWAGHIFIDFTVPIGLNSLTNPKACFSVAWNNLSSKKKYCGLPIDYIILDKKAPGFLPDNLFNQYLKNIDPKFLKDLLTDHASRKALAHGDTFDDRHYKNICNLETVQIFSAEKS